MSGLNYDDNDGEIKNPDASHLMLPSWPWPLTLTPGEYYQS